MCPTEPELDTQRREPEFDSLASGLSYSLITNIVQRGIGFLRNIALCYFLTDRELGFWALASTFFVLAAPLSVLGLPGCFGKFIEFFRVRGQFSTFVKQASIGSLFGSVLLLLLLVIFHRRSSVLVFGTELSASTMFIVAVVLLLVTAFNFVTELLSGLRQPRIVSRMLLVNSLVFTVASIAICFIRPSWESLVFAFGISALAGLLPATTLRQRLREYDETENGSSDPLGIWRRIFPFAISVWMMNALANSFDVVDRYMILNFITDSAVAHGVLGQLHSAKLLPALLVSLAMVVGGMLLPYLSAEWEKSNRAQVNAMMELTLKLGAFFCSCFAVATVVTAPILFRWIWAGRYSVGESMLSLVIACSSWASLTFLVQNYLWCIEKSKWITGSIAFSLAGNIALNGWMIPRWGLLGAVLATTIATLAHFAIIVWLSHRSGCRFSGSAIFLSLLPICVLISGYFAAIILAGIVVLAGRTSWFLTQDEKMVIERGLQPICRRLAWRQSCFALTPSC